MIPQTMPIFIATQPVDMRCGFNGLVKATEEVLRKDPRERALFVFCNRACDRIKILWWDKTGYCVLYKRLDRKWSFQIPKAGHPDIKSIEATGQELASILKGGLRRMTSENRREISRSLRHSVLRLVVEPATSPPA